MQQIIVAPKSRSRFNWRLVFPTEAGTTVITVTPEQAPTGTKYVWAFGSVAPTATVGSVLTGWNDLQNGATYPVPSGSSIVVAAVNLATSIVVATGQATAVSAAA